MESDDGDALVGQVLCGTYKVERQIGEGGMGAIYEASHVRLPRKFAIKMLHSDALASEEVFRRFRREAEIASSIGHDNIVQVLDFNHTPAGVPFMVLELLEGEDLEQRLERVGRLSLAETASLLKQVASGLEAAHEVGIVHRDLKPPNLFLCKRSDEPDRVKILDFGISKSINSTSMVTRTGSVMGSPNFMSPEQADGDVGEIDGRTDVFALGCILFHCLTGEYAFEGPTVMGTLYKIVHGKPANLKALAPELPKGVRDAIMHALDKDQASRTQSVSALRDEFLAACPDALLVVGAAATNTASVVTPVLATSNGHVSKSSLGTITAIIARSIATSRARRGLMVLMGLMLLGAVAVATMALSIAKPRSAESVDAPGVIDVIPATQTAVESPQALNEPRMSPDAGAVSETLHAADDVPQSETTPPPAVEQKAKTTSRKPSRRRPAAKKTSKVPKESEGTRNTEGDKEFWGPLSGR